MCIINDYELLNWEEQLRFCKLCLHTEDIVTYVPTYETLVLNPKSDSQNIRIYYFILHNILKKPLKAKKLFCGKVEKIRVMSKTANVRGKGFRTILTEERSYFFNIALKFSFFLERRSFVFCRLITLRNLEF